MRSPHACHTMQKNDDTQRQSKIVIPKTMKLYLIFLTTLKFLFPSILCGNCTLPSSLSKGVKDQRVSQNSSSVLRTYPLNPDQIQKLQQVEGHYDLWSAPIQCGPTDIRVIGSQVKILSNYLDKHGILWEVRIPDVVTLLGQDENGGVRIEAMKKKGSFNWKEYHDLDTIHRWLDTVGSKHSDAAKVMSIGKSLENRPLKLIKIGLSSGGGGKPSIWIDAGIHAREWVTPPVACYIINQLLTNREENQDILSQVDVYIIPVLNPDGYQFSRTKDRLWRKNRRKNSKGGCMGVDLNRNFGTKFGGSGSSANPCEEIFRGPRAFSEPESRAVKNFVEKNNKGNWTIYISLHTYGQAILTPWGFKTALPANYKQIKALGDKAAAAIKKVHGTKFRVGSAAKLFGTAAGCNDDWALGSGNFKFPYTLELRDKGQHGFLLPPNQILPTSQETFEGFKVFASSLFPSQRKNKWKNRKKY